MAIIYDAASIVYLGSKADLSWNKIKKHLHIGIWCYRYFC